MLFSRNNNACCSVGVPSEHEIPKFPVFPNLVSVENDASQAKVSNPLKHIDQWLPTQISGLVIESLKIELNRL